MAATQFGIGKWGIGADETGIIIQNISYNYSQDKKEVRNRTGDVAGISYYNERVEVKLQGVIPTTSAFSGSIAATLTLAVGNAIPDHLKGTVTGGSLIVEEVSREQSAEDYETIEVSATYYPSIAGS